MHRCTECGKEFETNKEFDIHFHLVQTVSAEAGVYLITLPDGCTPGRWEAAREFAEAVLELKVKVPNRTFSFTPFSFENVEPESGVNSWLAVAN